jgi:hypothetical protein
MSNIPKPDNDNAVIAELMREIKEMRSQLAQVQNVNNTGGQGVVSNSQNVLANNLATDKNKERAYSEQALQTTAQEAIERAHQDQISRNKFSAHVDGNLVASMMMQMPVTTFSGMNLVAYPIGISLPFGENYILTLEKIQKSWFKYWVSMLNRLERECEDLLNKTKKQFIH